ncbi:unnamed protein product, partial [Ectocarpus fasciculatus]
QETPLHLAASEGQVLCISELLLGGADKDIVDRFGRTPLFRAAENNRLGAVEKLLAAGANHGIRDNSNFSPVEFAAGEGRADVLKALLDKDSSKVDATDDAGWAALHIAANVNGPVRDNGDAVRVLLGAGADVNLKATNDWCYTPLHVAANRRIASDGTIRALLEGGANILARARREHTPLHVACKRSSVTGVDLLLRWGADENLTNNVGDTPSDVIGARQQNDLDDEEREADNQRIGRM